MRILYLEDDAKVRVRTVEWLLSQYGEACRIDAVSDILSFDELFTYKEYDKYIMDMQINRTVDIPTKEYDEFWKGKGVELSFEDGYTDLLEGWEYFCTVMAKEKDNPFFPHLGKVALLTSFGETMRKKFQPLIEERHLPTVLLCKGAENWEKEIKDFLNQ